MKDFLDGRQGFDRDEAIRLPARALRNSRCTRTRVRPEPWIAALHQWLTVTISDAYVFDPKHLFD
jgi:hypothetical protein